MTTQELVTRLTVYKREVFRRGIVLALAGLLPGVLVFLGIGYSLYPFDYSTGYILLFGAGFIFFLAALLLAFIYMVFRSLPRKLDLVCPGCSSLIIETPAQQLISNGKCVKCGCTLVDNSDVQKVSAHVV